MAKSRHQPSRTCVACRQGASKADLVRVARRPDGGVAVDVSGRLPGRGAYLHADRTCVETAQKRRALERALGAPVPADVWAQLKP